MTPEQLLDPEFRMSRQEFIRQRMIAAGLDAARDWDAVYGRAEAAAEAPLPDAAKLLTRDDAAAVLRISVASVDRLRRDGLLHNVKALEPRVLFEHSEVERVLAQRARKK